MVKTCTAVVVLLVTLAGALWALDSTYLRTIAFRQHQQQHAQQEMFSNQRQIWEYQDRARKYPQQRQEMEQRIRELEYRNRLLEKQLKGGG